MHRRYTATVRHNDPARMRASDEENFGAANGLPFQGVGANDRRYGTSHDRRSALRQCGPEHRLPGALSISPIACIGRGRADGDSHRDREREIEIHSLLNSADPTPDPVSPSPPSCVHRRPAGAGSFSQWRSFGRL
jgi:hypothetical protein